MSKQKAHYKGKLKRVETVLKKINNIPLEDYTRFDVGSMPVESFSDWGTFATSRKNPDEMRNALYYGFQPLYDALIEERVAGTRRSSAISLLNHLIQTSVDYLVSYYCGEPDVQTAKEQIRSAKEGLASINDISYKTKFRNVDHNYIYPANIGSFLVQFMENTLDEKVSPPDYVLGCACGSSELAMPLAGLLSADLDFIRRSHRRGDEGPKILPEQKKEIAKKILRRNVVCVEDFVCSGESLWEVMNHVKKHKPASVIGTSSHFSEQGRMLGVKVNEENFRLFSLKRVEAW